MLLMLIMMVSSSVIFVCSKSCMYCIVGFSLSKLKKDQEQQKIK